MASPITLVAKEPGSLQILNDTAGTLTVQISGVGTKSVGPGGTILWTLPAGWYTLTGWTEACEGIAGGDVEILAGETRYARFYCSETSRLPAGEGTVSLRFAAN